MSPLAWVAVSIARWRMRRRFNKITDREWPDGIMPAPPQPSKAWDGWTAHYDRLANEVVPETAIDGEDPK